MYKIDKTQNCNIFNSTFHNNLLPYYLKEKYERGPARIDNDPDMGVDIHYKRPSSLYNTVSEIFYPILIRQDLLTIIDNISTESTDIWTPYFIDQNFDIVNKPIFLKQQIKNPILGLENVLRFSGEFEDWDLERFPIDPNKPILRNCVSNWYTTSLTDTIIPKYSLLFWSKLESTGYKKIEIDEYELKVSVGGLLYTDVDNGCHIKNIKPYFFTIDNVSYRLPAFSTLVKINANYAKVVESAFFYGQNNNSVVDKIVNISKLMDGDKFVEIDNFYVSMVSPLDFKKEIGDKVYQRSLYMSDGECFSYFDSNIQEAKALARTENSKTYLSPILYSNYREIYHRLTLRTVKNTTSSLTRKQGLALQKLCYFLSTHPQIDRTTVDILNSQEIYDAVQTYISTPVTSLTEQTKLLEIIRLISGKFFNFNISSYKQSINQNYIYGQKDLTQKILNKYSSQILIDEDVTLKYKKPLANGPHAMVSLGAIDLYNQDIPSNEIIFNNCKMKIGDFNYSTEISTTGSLAHYSVVDDKVTPNIIYSSGTIPLADISIKNQDNEKVDFSFKDGKIFPADTSNNYTTIDSSKIIKTSNGVSKTIFYFWEQISGPNCLKFSDLNKDAKYKFNLTTYPTSTYETPEIYIGTPGIYEIKCTVTTKFGISSSDTYKFAVGNYTSDQLTEAQSITLPVDATKFNKVMLGTIPQIAFNKYGLVWILKSNNYIDVGPYNPLIQEDYYTPGIIRYNNFQFDIRKNAEKWIKTTKSADLQITLLNNNTKILLYNIALENMRDDSYGLSQCASFYEERLLREKDRSFTSPVTGASDFVRDYKYGYQLYYHTINGQSNRFETTTTPEVSTTIAPPILGYGGYDTDAAEKIGIKMPNHPNAGCEVPYLMNKNDFVRNDDISLSSGNLFCYLKEVQPTGSGHYAESSLGTFHPTGGWLPRDYDNGLYLGRSFVVKNDIKKHDSLIFNGPGILNIKPSLDGQPFNYQSIINLKVNTEYDINSRGVGTFGFNHYNVNTLNRQLNPNYICNDIDFMTNSWRLIREKRDSVEGIPTCNSSYTNYEIPKDYMDSDIEISDIEIKLNFLNYPNLKNLAIWLDVFGNNKTNFIGPLEDKDFFIDNPAKHTEKYPSVTNYLKKLELMNSSNRIYLLNQEYVSNYGHDNSITFTESISKNISFDKINYDKKIIWSDREVNLASNTVYPTTIANGYDDIDSNYYSVILKTNNINKLNNSFKKFVGKTLLKDGKTPLNFVLNISVIDPISYDTKILDNLLVNNSVLSSTENKLASNTSNNSLCSWDIIIHTKKIQKPLQTDVLGYINYSDPVNNTTLRDNDAVSLASPSGFNFLADFSDKNFLLPQININAPYNSLGSINSCFYDVPDSYRGRSTFPPKFEHTLYYILAIITAAAGGFGGIVGTLASMVFLEAVYGAGGRNDPIVNFLIEDRLLKNKDDSNQQYYKAVYSDLDFGSADRIVISISQDGLVWYDLEVPIFRYINTPILKQNRYKFIKLNENVGSPLSFFPFKKTITYKDLALSNCSVVVSSGIQPPLTGYKTIGGTNVRDLDIVLLDNQQNKDDNGYYIIPNETDPWVRVPSINELDFLIYNKVDSRANIYNDIKNEKSILIDGIRAYDFFDVGDTIFIKEPSGYNRILNKNLISTTDGMRTLLGLERVITQDSSISIKANESKTIFLYKDSYTTVSQDTFPINKWAFNKSQSEVLHSINPESRISCYGEGSIGWGSDINSPENLYKINLMNKTFDTNTLVSNISNDFYKFNDLSIATGTILSRDPNDVTNIFSQPPNQSSNNGISYKTYSYNDMGNIFENLTKQFDSSNTDYDRLIRTIRHSSYKNNQDKIFLEIKSEQFKDATFPPSGEMYIENDYKTTLITKFNETDIDLVRTGLNSLVQEMKRLSVLYDSLPEDIVDCYTRETYIPEICIKSEIKQQLRNLSYKKQKYQEALSIHSDVPGLPHISGYIDSNGNIGYKEQKDLYWFHIDQNQPCSLNNEISVKILVKTRYDILPIVDRGIIPDTFITPPQNQQIAVGDNLVSASNEGTKITYLVSQSGINAEKDRLNELYPSLNWAYSDNKDGKAGVGDQLFKYGGHYDPGANNGGSPYASSKKFIVSPVTESKNATGGGIRDIIVFVTEYYIRPAKLFAKLGTNKVKDVFTNLGQNSPNMKIKFKNIPRKLRDVDPSQYKKYTYDFRGNLVPNGISLSTLPVVENNFQCWECVNSSGNLVEKLPPYFVASNEMRYRAFFGSVDGIENKNTTITDSKQDWEWIPYEYYKRPCVLLLNDKNYSSTDIGGDVFGENSSFSIFRFVGSIMHMATEVESLLIDGTITKERLDLDSIKRKFKTIKKYSWIKKYTSHNNKKSYEVDITTTDPIPTVCSPYRCTEFICLGGLNDDGTISEGDCSREDFFTLRVYNKETNKLISYRKITKFVSIQCTETVLGTSWVDAINKDIVGRMVPDNFNGDWSIKIEDNITQYIDDTDPADLVRTIFNYPLRVGVQFPIESDIIPANTGDVICLKLRAPSVLNLCPGNTFDFRSVRVISPNKSCLGDVSACEDTTIMRHIDDWANGFGVHDEKVLSNGKKDVQLLYHSTVIPPPKCNPCGMNLSNKTLCGEAPDVELGKCIVEGIEIDLDK